MKRIIALLIAVLMLCTLVIPVFAANLGELYLYNETKTITEDAEFSNIEGKSGEHTFLVESGATVKTGRYFGGYNSHFVLKSGAKMICSGSFVGGGNENLASGLIEEGAELVLNSTSTNSTINFSYNFVIKGKVTGKTSSSISNTNYLYRDVKVEGDGIIDLTFSDKFNAYQLADSMQKNQNLFVTLNEGHVVVEAQHHFGKDGNATACERCGSANPNHTHIYDTTTFKCVCGAIGPHDHDFSKNYTCPCGVVMEHDHNFSVNHTCPCGVIEDHEHVYDEEKHTCSCGAVCAHVNGVDEDGKCKDCHHLCAHNGKCEVCGEDLAVTADIEEGDYIIYSALNKKKYVSIDGKKNSKNGAENVLLSENGEVKVFTVTKDAASNAYIIKSKDTGMLLDTAGGLTESGTNIWQWWDNAANGTYGNGQRWVFENAGKDQYYIRSLVQLYVTANSNDNINAKNFIGTGEQIFKLVKVDANGNPIGKLSLGSALSEGNLWIIIAIAVAAVFGLGGFFAGNTFAKKKSLVTANGAPVENKNDEDDE